MVVAPYNIYRLFLVISLAILVTILIYSTTSKSLIRNQSIGLKPHLTKYKKNFNVNETYSIFDDNNSDGDDSNEVEQFLDDSELIIEDGAINDEEEIDDDAFENFDTEDDGSIDKADEEADDDDDDDDNTENGNEEADYSFKQQETTTSILPPTTRLSNQLMRLKQHTSRPRIADEVVKDRKSSIRYTSIRHNQDDFCVIPSIFKTTKRKNKITMVLHTSSNYFGENLLKMSQKWDGQISLAIYTSAVIHSTNETQSSVENTIKKIHHLIDCYDYLKDSLNVHIVFSWDRNVSCPFIDLDQIPNKSCEDEIKTLEAFEFKTFSLMYPVNTMRNVARKYQDGEYVLFADMEQEYSSNAEAILRYLAHKWNIKDEKLGIAIRRFEYNESIAAPVTMDELRDAIAKKLVYQFHVFFWPQGHKIAKLKEWLNETHTFDDVISNDDFENEDEDEDTEESKRWLLSNAHTVDIKRLGTTYWEPMLVMHKSALWHNEELPYGLDNHVALALHLCSAGYLFPVAPNVFSMHPGVRLKKERRKLAYKGVFHGNKALRRFYERMAKEHPVNSKKCLKNRLPKHLRENHK